MVLLQDGVIAFLAAVGLASLFWAVAGALLPGDKCTNPALLLVLPVRDDAPAMESDLRELLRLRRSAPKATIVLADCGLTPEAHMRAEYWCEREKGLTLCQPPIEVVHM